MSGNQNGTLSVWDLTSAPVSQLNSDPVLPAMSTFLAHNDTVNGLRCVRAPDFLFVVQPTVLYVAVLSF